MSKYCAVWGVLGALALPSAALAVPGPPAVPPGPPAAPPGCVTAKAHAAAPAQAALLAHCPNPEAPPPA
jgi:hypothetical protein